MKKAILWGTVVLFLLVFVFPFLTFLPELFLYGGLEKNSNITDKAVDKLAEKKSSVVNVIPTKIPVEKRTKNFPLLTYNNIPSEYKNYRFNCEDKGFAPKPLRNSKYFCLNVYSADADTVLTDFEKSGADRLLFYGKNSYFDCPVFLGKNQTLVNKCLNASLFLDYWQIRKMSEIIGVPSLSSKLYVYFLKTQKEIGDYCGVPTASACFNGDENALYLTAASSIDKFYQQEFKASIYEGQNHEIAYNFNMKLPSNCYATDVHELTHFFNEQYFGYNIARQWFAESITYLLVPWILKDICPPGPSFSNVVKKANGQEQKLTSFDLTTLDLEDPLDSAIERYTEGNICMKAIFKEVARSYKESGSSVVPRFYFEIKRMNKSHENDFARALYLAEGSPQWLKTYFNQNGCVF